MNDNFDKFYVGLTVQSLKIRAINVENAKCRAMRLV